MLFFQLLCALVVWSLINVFIVIFLLKRLSKSTDKKLVDLKRLILVKIMKGVVGNE